MCCFKDASRASPWLHDLSPCIPPFSALVYQTQGASCSLPWTALIIIPSRYWTANLQLICKLFFISPLLSFQSSTSVLPSITLNTSKEPSATPAKSFHCPPSNTFLNLICYDNYKKNLTARRLLRKAETTIYPHGWFFFSPFLCNSPSVFVFYVTLSLIITYE